MLMRGVSFQIADEKVPREVGYRRASRIKLLSNRGSYVYKYAGVLDPPGLLLSGMTYESSVELIKHWQQDRTE